MAHAVLHGGTLTLWLALASPIDPMGQFLLTAHMAQHLILMSIAPPLVILGAPQVPLLRGLPRGSIRDGVAQWINLKPVHFLQRFFTHPTLWLDWDERRVCRVACACGL